MIGMDEAGRGPVLGPLVVAAMQIDDERFLKDIGVRDSKRLSPKRRERLYQELITCCEFRAESVSAREIDELRRNATLNKIEESLFIKAASDLEYADEPLYVDCCDTDERRFGNALEAGLPGARVCSCHRADEKYPCVAAASIIAKVIRDSNISHLNEVAIERWGIGIGSGYPSDPDTCRFLQYFKENKEEMPFFVRRSWKTVQNLGQSTLDAYNE
ncbi:MAG: ribonuclease HII [Candidatus Methanofastidiosa archaeon]|nr:ribonuclease HII [Candidatus Methanofastidiosa archaeon]